MLCGAASLTFAIFLGESALFNFSKWLQSLKSFLGRQDDVQWGGPLLPCQLWEVLLLLPRQHTLLHRHPHR